MESKDLPRYMKFREAVVLLQRTSSSLSNFNEQLKKDSRFKNLRSGARRELQAIYDAVRQDLSLPNIPIWLSPRKKVIKRGVALSVDDMPKEIRIYPIVPPLGIHSSQWSPSQFTVCSKFEVFDTFRHEIAHVMECQRHGFLNTHGPEFVMAYDEIGQYFRSHGYGELIKPFLELSGVPSGSYAQVEAARRRPAPERKPTVGSSGCLIQIWLAVTTVAFVLTICSWIA